MKRCRSLSLSPRLHGSHHHGSSTDGPHHRSVHPAGPHGATQRRRGGRVLVVPSSPSAPRSTADHRTTPAEFLASWGYYYWPEILRDRILEAVVTRLSQRCYYWFCEVHRCLDWFPTQQYMDDWFGTARCVCVSPVLSFHSLPQDTPPATRRLATGVAGLQRERGTDCRCCCSVLTVSSPACLLRPTHLPRTTAAAVCVCWYSARPVLALVVVITREG